MQTVLTRQTAEARAGLHSILIVDDDSIIRIATADYLRDRGYHVVEADHVSAAIFILHNTAQPFGLVFASVEQPDLRGLDLARWVRDHYPGLPVLLASSSARTADLGADLGSLGPIVSKPYRGDVLARRIQNRLHRSEEVAR